MERLFSRPKSSFGLGCHLLLLLLPSAAADPSYRGPLNQNLGCPLLLLLQFQAALKRAEVEREEEARQALEEQRAREQKQFQVGQVGVGQQKLRSRLELCVRE